ncbi:DUF4252 domain-containing protein [Maribellus comscasis]|uniref:DUF4252 domain-containing protein n=1 Tax=Maribellus comscasis TaxID=2681766 RepID=A0A6I6JN12_9BACT|nr:DUF4252 domain-containing protein [Maribellus comscasis]QGY44346.1 DUF4252 domain-containing protein [Maribellus comscasis]
MRTIRIFIVVTLVLAVQLSNAQSKSYRMYDAFANKDGVTNFSFTKNMTDAFNIDLGDDDDEKKVTGDLNEVRFMSYNPKKGGMSGPEFTKRAVGMLPSQYKKYEDEDNDSDAEIWLLGGRKKFKECHVFLNNESDDQMRFVVSFYGDFTVQDLEGLKETGRSFSDD